MARIVVALIAGLVIGTVASAQDAGAARRSQPAPARSNIYKLEELRAPHIDALDRERTLFILPVGMIEVHGPHLPVGTDTLGLIDEANAASKRVSAALANWNIVMMFTHPRFETIPPVAAVAAAEDDCGLSQASIAAATRSIAMPNEAG
jgi:hypothetical protein